MLTISAFLVVIAFVIGSVWWACRKETAPPADAPSDIAST
jgi:hypothetical protein